MVALAIPRTAPYVGWEEVVEPTEKGRREVRYYLKRGGGGGSDLVVVGKEKSTRHMSYRFVKDNKLCLSSINRSSMMKLRSRKEVIDCLGSIISAADEHPDYLLKKVGSDMQIKYDSDFSKDVQMNQLGQCKTEITWLGSPWTCRKRRRHYQSFRRNSVIVSVHDFVYVLAEENERLVAHLDDIYEDSKGNKMVVVRWFHKIDELGFVSPRDYNDREIFFSLCLQDLNIECIDGLATVLGPEHYNKFMLKGIQMGLAPFLCRRQFDNDDVKPFDITRVKGYWKQAILKNASSPVHEPSDTKQNWKGSVDDAVGCRPSKKIRLSKESDNHLRLAEKTSAAETGFLESEGAVKVNNLKEVCNSQSLIGKDDTMSGTVARHVEVLCQDSGIRGCWFRALIIKKHKNKIKVQYQDLKDADDDGKNLEEWVIASRLAAPDVLGIRISGRTIVRPTRLPDRGGISSLLNIGTVVDAWRHDGWWEGIVVKKEAEDKLHVYFPEEKQQGVFSPEDLRRSHEWVENNWQNIKERSEIVSKLFDPKLESISNTKISSYKENISPIDDEDLPKKEVKSGVSISEAIFKKPSDRTVVRDLSKDGVLAQLKWKSSGKRRLGRSPVHKVHYACNSNNDSSGMLAFDKLFVDSSLKYDTDNCKYSKDFGSSVVPPLSSLVMSR